jgi:predicted 3-demethylubiquinone-9 3-methyltransferase (glyoxalase superfamily)
MTPPVPCLWFDDQALDAARFYVGLFGGQIRRTSYYQANMHLPEGTAMLVEFSIDGRDFQALNGGPTFTLTPAFSMAVGFDTQNDLDRIWDTLLADGGQASQCGWLTDKFGVSWQIYPNIMPAILTGPDTEGAARAMQAMMGMIKLDIAALQTAFEGRTT